MREIYNILFVENINPYAFLLMIGIASVSLIGMKYAGNINYSKWFFLGTSFLFSLAVLIHTTSYKKEDYSSLVRHHDTGCLYETYNENDVDVVEDMPYQILLLHYFEGDKELVLHESLENADEVSAWIAELCPKIRITNKSIDEISFIETDIETIKEHTSRIKSPEGRFIIDNSWKDSDTVIAFSVEEDNYFVSEKLFNDLNAGNYEGDYLHDELVMCSAHEVFSKIRGERDIYQVIILFFMFIIGFLISKVIFGGDDDYLSACMAIPVFSSVYSTLTIVSILLGLQINRLFTILVVLLILCIAVWMMIKTKTRFDIKRTVVCGVAAILIITILVNCKMWIMATDGYVKTYNAVLMAEYSLSRTELLSFIPWGMFDSIINNIAWIFNVDFLYAIYPIWRISSLGIVVCLQKKYMKKTKFTMSFLVAAFLLLITNMDIILHTFFIMTNGMIGCMILLLIVAIILRVEKGYCTDIIIYSTLMVIITSRVEGACYICLIFALFCGLKSYRKSCKVVNTVSAIEILVWEGGLMLFCDENSVFWDPKKGTMLMLAGFALIVLPYVLEIPIKALDYIKKYYYWISVGLLSVCSLFILFFGPESAYSTAQNYAKHFATSFISNSGAFWGFALLMVPFAFIKKTKKKGLVLAIVVDYLLLTYMIFSFRQDGPVHIWVNDSCRRVLQQIMPTTLFAIIYFVCETEKELNG